jgi:hypothetical protein
MNKYQLRSANGFARLQAEVSDVMIVERITPRRYRIRAVVDGVFLKLNDTIAVSNVCVTSYSEIRKIAQRQRDDKYQRDTTAIRLAEKIAQTRSSR